jgi:hypothetical protein
MSIVTVYECLDKLLEKIIKSQVKVILLKLNSVLGSFLPNLRPGPEMMTLDESDFLPNLFPEKKYHFIHLNLIKVRTIN